MCPEFQSVNRAGQFSRGKVVVVDDEEYICIHCIEVLQDDGYEVKAFTAANDALRYLDDQSTDLDHGRCARVSVPSMRWR